MHCTEFELEPFLTVVIDTPLKRRSANVAKAICNGKLKKLCMSVMYECNNVSYSYIKVASSREEVHSVMEDILHSRIIEEVRKPLSQIVHFNLILDIFSFMYQRTLDVHV